MKKMLLSVMVMYLSAMIHVLGQSFTNFEIIPPTVANPEHQLFGMSGGTPLHVANASLQLTSQWGMTRLNAVVYNDNAGAMNLDILTMDDNSNILSMGAVMLPVNGYFPDVIIRDDISNPGQGWIVSVVLNSHNCPVSEVFLVEYRIDNPFSVNINLSNIAMIGNGIFPKIDGFIDHNIVIDNELFAMTDFAIVYNNLDLVSNITLMHYDINSSLVNMDIINGFLGFAPDVACMTNVNMGGAKFVHIVDINYTPPPPGGNVNLLLYDINAMAVVSHDVSNYPSYLPFYRIDAHSLVEDFWNQNRYILSGTHDCNDHFFMADDFTATFNNPFTYPTITPVAPPTADFRPNGAHTVAAGMGYDLTSGMPPGFPFMPAGSRINREEFTSLHSYINGLNDGDLMLTNYMRPTGYNTPILDMFRVNNTPYFYGSMIPPVSRQICNTCSAFNATASGISVICGHTDYSYFFNSSVATQPNLGDYTVACWVDEASGSIKLKQTNNYGSMGGSIISHEADAVTEPTTGAAAPMVFPNPVKDVVHITAGGTIEYVAVFNVLGQCIRQYPDVNSSKYTIHVADLGTGSQALMLQVSIDGKKYVSKVLLNKE